MDYTDRYGWLLVLLILSGCDQGPRSVRSSSTDPAAPNEQSQPSSGQASVSDVPEVAVVEAGEPADPPETSLTPDASDPVAPGAPSQPASAPMTAELKSRVAELTNEDAAVREAAANELEGSLGNQLAPVAVLLRDESDTVRQGAAFFLLERFDVGDDDMVQAWIAALADESGTVRHIALTAVRRFESGALMSAGPQLAERLNVETEPDANNRAAAARLLGVLANAGRDWLPGLTAAVQNDSDAGVRAAALLAISQIAEPAAAVPIFRQVLEDDAEANVRGLAAVRLGRLGPEAADAAATLANTLTADNDALNRKTTQALIAIGPAAVPPLVEQLANSKVEVRRLAVYGLGKLGPQAAAARESLEKLRVDPDEEVRQLAELALRQIGPER